MDSITILQPVGLGDIMFCQKIAHKLIEYGFNVFWPMDYYKWVPNYIIKPGLDFNSTNNPSLVLNLRNSIESNHPYDIMTCKYNMIGKTLPILNKELHEIDYRDWSDYLTIQRNKEKEDKLYYDILGLKDNEEYVFINKSYARNLIMHNVEGLIENKSIKKIQLYELRDYSLFDWSKVIENAVEIHTVDTSINYLIEILKIKATTLKMYARNNDTYKCLHSLFKTNWDWI